MKLALVYDAVYPWLKGGGEKTLYELACALRDRGHECHLFGMQLWPGPRDRMQDGLHYHGLSPAMPLYGRGGRRRAGPPLRFALGMSANLPRYEPSSFDLFDVHAFPFLSFPAFHRVHRRRMPDVPWLLTWLEVWGDDYWRRYLGWKGAVGAAFERYAARTAPHHLCISPTTGRRLTELLGVATDRVSVIPRGFAAAHAAADVARDHRRVVAAGRLLPYKRVDLLVRAWPDVLRAVPDARLEIIGDGPERAALVRLADELGIARAVDFRGQLSESSQVLDTVAAAALVVQPSAREGQSTIVLEALSLGTPVLAAVGPETAVGDFLGPEAVSAAARLDVSAPAAAWSARIVELLENAPLRAQLAAVGRGAVERLGWREEIAPRVESLYLEQIARQRAARRR